MIDGRLQAWVLRLVRVVELLAFVAVVLPKTYRRCADSQLASQRG
jgi:hypothetical protein